MRTVIVLLVGLLVPMPLALAQTSPSPEEFSLSVSILDLQIPSIVVPLVRPGEVWYGLTNRTSVPYSLCTRGTSWRTSPSSGIGTGASPAVTHCGTFWILLPGHTRFEQLGMLAPEDRAASLHVIVMLEGKPLGVPGVVTNWNLSWAGTVAEGIANGERLTTIPR
jgi:hypothetical protein